MQIILDMHEKAVQYILERTTELKLPMNEYLLELVRTDWKKNRPRKEQEDRND